MMRMILRARMASSTTSAYAFFPSTPAPYSVQPIKIDATLRGENNGMLLCIEKDWWFDNSPPDRPRGDVKICSTSQVGSPSEEYYDRAVGWVAIIHGLNPKLSLLRCRHPEGSLSTDNLLDGSR